MTPRHKESDRDRITQRTRILLLQAAADEFNWHGYEGANVNRIAKAAGYSIGTFYNYFPSKRELMEAFIDQAGREHVEYILDRVRGESNPDQRIYIFFQAGFEFVSQHLAQSRGIFNALNGPDQAFRMRLFQVYAPLFTMIQTEILQPEIDDGVYRSQDPQKTAGLIMLIYLGVGSQITPEGSHWVDARDVADFVKRALAAC